MDEINTITVIFIKLFKFPSLPQFYSKTPTQSRFQRLIIYVL